MHSACCQMILHQLLEWLLLLQFVSASTAAECDPLSLSVPCVCGSHLEQKFEHARSDHWQRLAGAPVEVFSSYLDERQWTLPTTVRLPHSTTTVRTIAHGLQTEHAVNDIPPIFCYVHDGVEWTHVGRAEYLRVYRSGHHADEYTAHFLLCFVSNSSRPITTVGFGTVFCQIDVAVNVKYPMVPPPTDGNITLHVCVSPLYGVVQPIQVAEFVEMYRLLGATHFTFYDYKVTPSLLHLLNRYSEANLATIVPWYSLDRRLKLFYFDQRSALNDCLYRNAAATHIAVVDLDEFLVPRIRPNTSLIDLIDHLQRSSQNSLFGSYCFQHVYFELNASDPHVEQQMKNSQLRTQTRFSRTSESYPKGTVRSKCIHSPHLNVAIDIHSVQWSLNNSIEQTVLPEDTAILHHYRSTRMETFIKHPERFTFENDYFLQTFYEALSANVNAALSEQRTNIHPHIRIEEEL